MTDEQMEARLAVIHTCHPELAKLDREGRTRVLACLLTMFDAEQDVAAVMRRSADALTTRKP